MPSFLSADDIIEIAGGRLAQGMVPEESGPLAIDTRSGVEGAWYLALKGGKYDGHDFMGDAFNSGALGCIVEERHNYPLPSTQFPIIAVPDTLVALRDLARNWRRRLGVKVVAIVHADRDRSLALAKNVEKLIKTKFETQLLDLSAGVEEPLYELVSLEEETRIVVANMVPPMLEDIEFASWALCPSIIIFVDEPFGYMRMAVQQERLVKQTDIMLSMMDKSQGLVLTCGEEPKAFLEHGVPVPHKLKHYQGPQAPPQMPSSAAVDCFMPTTEESWCVAEACKEVGIPDDIIYGAFV